MAVGHTYHFDDTNLESWEEVVTNITPTKTPVLSGIGKTKVTARRHEWAKDSLAAATINKAVENSTLTDGGAVARDYDYNYTQVVTSKWAITATQEAVAKAGGVSSEDAYQMDKAMKEHARDIEYSLINGTGNSGASGTAREMRGLLTMITTNVETGTGTGSEALTETMFNDLLETVWLAAGDQADWCITNSFQKRKISQFDAFGKVERTQSATEGKISAPIEYYLSDFGEVRISLDHHMPQNAVAVVTKDKLKLGQLRPTHRPELAKTTDGFTGAWVSEVTLVVLAEEACGKITQLTTS